MRPYRDAQLWSAASTRTDGGRTDGSSGKPWRRCLRGGLGLRIEALASPPDHDLGAAPDVRERELREPIVPLWDCRLHVPVLELERRSQAR